MYAHLAILEGLLYPAKKWSTMPKSPYKAYGDRVVVKRIQEATPEEVTKGGIHLPEAVLRAAREAKHFAEGMILDSSDPNLPEGVNVLFLHEGLVHVNDIYFLKKENILCTLA